MNPRPQGHSSTGKQSVGCILYASVYLNTVQEHRVTSGRDEGEGVGHISERTEAIIEAILFHGSGDAKTGSRRRVGWTRGSSEYSGHDDLRRCDHVIT